MAYNPDSKKLFEWTMEDPNQVEIYDGTSYELLEPSQWAPMPTLVFTIPPANYFMLATAANKPKKIFVRSVSWTRRAARR